MPRLLSTALFCTCGRAVGQMALRAGRLSCSPRWLCEPGMLTLQTPTGEWST